MKYCKIFLFLLLMIIDVSTNAQEVTCEAEQLINVDILIGHPSISSPYKPGHILVFRCTDVKLKMDGQRTIECLSNGKWNHPFPKCEEVTCNLNTRENNIKIEQFPDFECPVKPGYNLTFSCNGQGLILKGQREITCQSNGEWSGPFPSCEAQCHKPRENFMKLVNEKDVYENEEILNYKCIEPYNEIPEGRFICKNGNWRGNFDCTSKTCPPPPYVENGDYIIRDRDGEVITEVQYTCKTYYVLNKQKQYYKCENGIWETPPTCLKPCEMTPEIAEEHNLEPIREKLYVSHGKGDQVYCKYSDAIGWKVAYITCSDGKLTIEPCKRFSYG